MYAGTTLNNFSGNVVGAHQKIDRVAFRVLSKATTVQHFPSRKTILFFEGKNGPDGIKSKSPAQNEPWHFYDPFDTEDTLLIDTISDHFNTLVEELKSGNKERAAFEASWLAHAVVDGLTPAHHYPFEEKLTEMRGGEGNDTRDSIKEKLVMKGDTKKEFLANNWKMWGVKGVMVSHGMFEFGVAAIIAPLQFRKVKLTTDDFEKFNEIGIGEYYQRVARKIATWNLYEEYISYGWTVNLSKKVRDDLVPDIIHTTALFWYMALSEAGLTAEPTHAHK